MADIIHLQPQDQPAPVTKGLSVCLEAVDKLRQDLIEGKVKAFFGVSLDVEHATYCYAGSVLPTSRLEAQGCIAHLLHMVQHGELNE